MKKRGLFAVTVLTFLFSGLWMAHAGWFQEQRPAARTAPQRPAQVREQDNDGFDPMSSAAAWRYRRNQASNWRSVLMYR